MTRVILIDDQVRAWLESQAVEGDTHNLILRRILGLDFDSDTAPGDQTAPDTDADTDADADADADGPPTP
ncbi:hypothetical protein [Actinomadura algeriensis]|uniref:Arc/MetJ-type ribon-helix-helix transcriptional regulator n=1 Tax=Actinomadura algeriensis TaxID=1679523 RepID=A0ABR9JRN7_9ACTN|nr:hypothetical protein [Actinomadura algeriensis]MBE1533246.1 hypothetical protein [Actinomadura algeriensis]